MSPRTSKRSFPVVALLTDFGTSDHYVAAMKGVILSYDPRIRCLDITHDVEPGRIWSAAFTLWAVHRDLPAGCVCIAVVDPGVGTDRDIVCTVADGRVYLAPDNGLMDLVLSDARRVRQHTVSMKKAGRFLPHAISSTFHGRDIFAPLGAHLATGTAPDALGTKKKFVPPHEWRVQRPSTTVAPAIMHIDRFGNILTNVAASNSRILQQEVRAISVGKVMVSVAVTTFEESPENTPCIIAGSSGLAEIIVKNGSAAEMLRVNDRTPIRIVWSGDIGQG